MDRVGETTLPSIVREKAVMAAEQPFLVHEDLEGRVSTLTFAQMHEAATRCAAALQALGAKKGDRVFVFLRNTADFVPLWFGIAAAGCIIAPGNIYLTAREIEFVIAKSRPRIIVTESRFLGLIEEAAAACAIDASIISADGGARAGSLPELLAAAPAFLPVEISSDDVAEILFTSGTSANPKGVMLTHANLVWCGLSGVANTGIGPADRLFNNKPLFHVNCQETVLACLTAGATAIIGERYSASRYLSQLVRHRATVCSLSAMLCRTLLNQPPSELDRAHTIRFAGYGINIAEAEIAAFVERFGMRIRNGYGQTEAMVYISVEALTSPSTYPSIGRPALEREVFIVDELNRPLPAGEVGEIVVKGRPGRNLMLGYFEDEEATRAAFDGGWLHSGDLGSFDASGNLYFHGRRGDMIKRAGENISVQEVESVLVSHPGVADVAVVGIDDPVRDQAVKAFIVRRDGHRPSEDELRDFCRERLAYFKVPEFVAFVPVLPRNASGKISKRELLAPLEQWQGKGAG